MIQRDEATGFQKAIHLTFIGLVAFCLTFLAFELAKPKKVSESQELVEIVDVGEVDKDDLIACLRQVGGDTSDFERKVNQDDVQYRKEQARIAEELAFKKGIALGLGLGVAGSAFLGLLVTSNRGNSDD